MTLNEAIAILKKRAESPFVRANQDTKEAMLLGMHALINLRNQRASGIAALDYRLPGEDEKGGDRGDGGQTRQNQL